MEKSEFKYSLVRCTDRFHDDDVIEEFATFRLAEKAMRLAYVEDLSSRYCIFKFREVARIGPIEPEPQRG